MSTLTKKLWFKAIAMALVISFVTLDIAWANPTGPSGSATLNVPSLFQQPIQAELAAKSLAINGIAKFLLGDKTTGDKAFELKYLQSTLSAEIKRGLDGIDLSRVAIKDNGIILIPFENARGRFLIQVAAKDNPAVKDILGFAGDVSDKYVVKVAARFRSGQGPRVSAKLIVPEAVKTGDVPQGDTFADIKDAAQKPVAEAGQQVKGEDKESGVIEKEVRRSSRLYSIEPITMSVGDVAL